MAAMSAFGRMLDSDVFHSFKRNPVVVVSAIVTLLFVLSAVFAPWVTPYDPYNLAKLDLNDAFTPPAWTPEGSAKFLLGSDDQGRDVLSTIVYGARVSLLVGFSAVAFAMTVGITLGLVSGYVGGAVESAIMRVADIQLTFPTILIALLIDGLSRAALPRDLHSEIALYVVIFAIGIASWPQFARTVRGSTLVEKNKEYVQAARVIGLHPGVIMLRHVLPNVLGPVLVIATLSLGLAILSEATLSFLGVGVPPTRPSLGTLIRIGNDFLFSGSWWMVAFPGITLAVLVLAVNLLGDWLRDALNPKLR